MRKSGWMFAAQVLLGVVLLSAWVSLVDLQSVWKAIRNAGQGHVGVAILLSISSTIARSIRWRQILKPIRRVHTADIWQISVASSLINFVIPIRSGELARALFLKQRFRIPVSVSLPTVAVDRSLDLFAVLVVGAFGAMSGIAIEGSVSAVLILGGLLFTGFTALVAAAIVAQDRLLQFLRRLLPSSVGVRIRDRIIRVAEGVLVGFAAIGRQPRSLLPLAGLSFAATLLDASVLFVLFLSLGIAVSPVIALVGYALFVITFLVPGAPGYIGSMEAFGSLVFGALGVGGVQAASVIVLFHALNAVMLGLLGGLAIWTLGLRPRSALRSVLQTEPENGD